MARVKGALATRKRRKKVLKLAKGYFGAKSKLFKTAKEAVMKSGNYAYIGRKQKKRDFRRLWITRISAACKLNDINYSTFINGLNKAGVTINRKMMADLENSLIKLISALQTSAKKRREQRLFVIEGLRICADAYENGIRFDKLIVSETAFSKYEKDYYF